MNPSEKKSRPWALIVVFLLLAASIAVAAGIAFRSQSEALREHELHKLEAIARLKADGITRWLVERRANAISIGRNAAVRAALARWVDRRDDAARKNLLEMLQERIFLHGFSEVDVTDAEGRSFLNDGHDRRKHEPVLGAIREAARTGAVIFADLHRDPGDDAIHFAYLSPVFADGEGGRLLGILYLELMADDFLHSFLKSWPTEETATGESILVRQEGDDVLHLSELRHRPGAALDLRLPLSNTSLPAARAVRGRIRGETGRDYRGMPVLAAAQPVSGTPWIVIAKMDETEALADIRQLAWLTGLLMAAALAVAIAFVGFLWQRQRRRAAEHAAAQSRALGEHQAQYLQLFENMPSGVAIYHAVDEGADFVFAGINGAVERIEQIRREDILGRRVTEVFPGVVEFGLLEVFRRVWRTGEAEHFPIAFYRDKRISGWRDNHIYRLPGGEVVAIYDDVTARKQAEESLRQAATVFESTHDGVTISDMDGNILAVNKAFTEITGYSEAEVLGLNPRILKSGRQKRDFYQAMWASLLSTGQWQGEIWNRRKNGEIYPEWLTINVVRNERGEPTHYVGVFTDISKLKQGEEQMDHLAHYDPLTDLPNRLLLQSRLAHAVERAGRRGYRVGVLFIDLDRFKTINDSFGHTVGDELLVAVVERLKGRVRDEDTLGRLGGDEFMLVLEPLDELQQAATVARDLLGLLAAPFSLPSGHEVFVGASVGISVFPEDGGSATDLLRDADAAMYRAKDQGRNQFCFYTADMNADAVAQLELESALRRALERDELVLHYQPKVDLRSGRMSGAEALIRWQRDGHLVPPIMFIPLAERTGLIVDIGNWVIDVACRQLRAWIDAGLGLPHVAVNVSARQFLSGDLKRVVSEALARHGVLPECLELELTESMLMEDHDRAVAMLDELRALGVRLSLDDFGTGYSSFGYLSRFAIDTLKIDQSFVRGIATEPGAALIAVAIIDLAHRMKLKVVAEGVETEAQLGYLRMRGCDEMQGYLFSRPVPAADFAELLRQEKSLPPMVREGAELRTLLIVDDEPGILSALGRALRGEGYRVLAAGSAQEGLELLATNDIQVILSDQRMPEMSGTEFLVRAKDIHPDTVRIVLTGYTDLESVTQAVNEGAIYRFLTKPWDDEQLRGHIREAFLYHDAIIKPRAAEAS